MEFSLYEPFWCRAFGLIVGDFGSMGFRVSASGFRV